MSEPRYPDITIDISEVDGNAFGVLGACMKALKKAGGDGIIPKEDVQSLIHEFNEEAMSDDYDNLLQTMMRWFDVN